MPSGSGCNPAPGTPLVSGSITLAPGIPINRHPPLLTLARVLHVGSRTEKWGDVHRSNALASKSRNFSHSFAPYSSPRRAYSGCDSWPVPSKDTKQWKQQNIINTVSYYYKRDIINWKHKDHFIFINSLMHMRKVFDIFYTSNSFLHALLSRLHQSSSV